MTKVTIELPDEVAEVINQAAEELGTTSDELLVQVVADAVHDMPGTSEDEDWRYR
ncbi:hypothetical protein [Roseomonas sp. BN140053]|uniref:hypothetical protein n=1 Tax=Roseomonas sp. BN140053 TaxID=3391898 RepID=UPI0039E7E1F3